MESKNYLNYMANWVNKFPASDVKLDMDGTIIFRNVRLNITPNELFEYRTKNKLSTQQALVAILNPILQQIRDEKLEFITN